MKTTHKQVKVVTDDGDKIYVDKGLEDIIANLYRWQFPTSLSCINNNGRVWIAFNHLSDVRRMMQMILNHDTRVNHKKRVQDTLWHFFFRSQKRFHPRPYTRGPLRGAGRPEFSILFGEKFIHDKNAVFPTGSLTSCISLRFPKKHLTVFKRLFFEVFPPMKKRKKPLLSQR